MVFLSGGIMCEGLVIAGAAGVPGRGRGEWDNFWTMIPLLEPGARANHASTPTSLSTHVLPGPRRCLHKW